MSSRSARLALLLLTLGASAQARADDLPVNMQVQLLSKISTYITDFGSAQTHVVKIVVVSPPPASGPSRGAQGLMTAITQAGPLGQFTSEPKLVTYSDLKTFQDLLTASKPHVLYLAPELNESQVAEIVAVALTTKTLTLSGSAEHVKLGVILGFSLVESRPRVLINLKQAQKQNVVFLSGLVSHSMVVDR